MDFHFKENLYKYWKSKQFREIKVYSDPTENNKTKIITQLDILNKIAENINLALNNKGFRDIFITASTGLGKSLLFQLPAIDLHKNGLIVIVITPLIALMNDQVNSLKNKGIEFAACINSDDTYLEREEKLKGIREGKYSLIYVSPEFLVRFKNLSSFFNINKDRRIGLYVIDEAHCVFTWGTGFRPDYWFLGKRLKDWRKKEECNAPIVALTATAVNGGDFDSVSEVIEMLDLQIYPKDDNSPKDDLILSYIKRDNIEIIISKIEQNLSKSQKRKFVITNLGKELKEKYNKTIIYHPFKRDASQLSEELSNLGIKSKFYVGEMSKEGKENVVNEFKDGKLDCIVATKAFGMGVDIDDIDCVYHYAINESITEYTQEIGRAGRKKEIKAYALSDFHKKDLDYTKWLNKSSSLTQWQIRKILEKIFYIYKECHNYEGFKSILIYPDTFFDLVKRKDKDYINNIETALLLLEKDIFNRFGDQILYFDIPETTEVFCFIRNEEIFKLKNSPYCMCFQHLLDKANGTIYKLNLEQFWKKFSRSERLGYLKYNFFKGKLLEGIKIDPRIEIKANLINEFGKSKSELDKILQKIRDLALNFGDSFFKEEKFINNFKRELNIKDNTISEIILSLFSFEQGEDQSGLNYKFIRKNDYGNYKIMKNGIKRFNDFIKSNFLELFKDQQIFHEYLPINEADQKKLVLGFFELFNLVAFQLKGSENIAYEILIEDPKKIENLICNYFNKELDKVKNRKNKELSLIEKFCNDYKDSNQAWEFLENYFLGRYRYSSNEVTYTSLGIKNQIISPDEFSSSEPSEISVSETSKLLFTECSVDDMIIHDKWGNGKVIKISSDKKTMTVNFDSVGEKILDPRYAPIKKVTSENKEDVIYPGTLVELEDLETENRVTYCIAEINAPLSEIDGETTISVESPLGRELLGCKKEDVITIQLHTGKYKKYKIIEFVKM